jgi:hypothetical protein
MSALSALVHFACPLLIIVLQISFNNLLRIEIRKELHVALSGWRSPSQQISDYARFTAMSQASDSSKLHFPPFPEDMLEWVPWLHQQYHVANTCTIRIKNADNKWETISYLSMYLMGYRWDVTKDMWDADAADIEKLTAAEIIKYTPTATAQEQGFLKEDDKLFHFASARLHRQMQVTLRTALLDALRDHALFPEIEYSTRPLGLWICIRALVSWPS